MATVGCKPQPKEESKAIPEDLLGALLKDYNPKRPHRSRWQMTPMEYWKKVDINENEMKKELLIDVAQ